MGLLDRLWGHRHEVTNLLIMVVQGKVYSWDGRKIRKAGGSGVVNAITEHDGCIVEGGIGGIRELSLIDDIAPFRHKGELGKEIRARESVVALCSLGEHLYDATNGSPDNTSSEIHETLSDRLLARRDAPIRALHAHEGRLFDSGWYGTFATFDNQKVSDKCYEALFSHEGVLYGGTSLEVHDVLRGGVVATRRADVCSLCSHNGLLLDAVNAMMSIGNEPGAIRETFSGKIVVPYESFAKARRPYRHKTLAVGSMISASLEVLERSLGK